MHATLILSCSLALVGAAIAPAEGCEQMEMGRERRSPATQRCPLAGRLLQLAARPSQAYLDVRRQRGHHLLRRGVRQAAEDCRERAGRWRRRQMV